MKNTARNVSLLAIACGLFALFNTITAVHASTPTVAPFLIALPLNQQWGAFLNGSGNGLIQSGNRAIVASFQDNPSISAFDMATGKALWHNAVPLPGQFDFGGCMAADDTVTVVSQGGDVAAFSSSDGRLLWKQTLPGAVTHLYVSQGYVDVAWNSHRLTQYAADSGAMIWSQEEPSAISSVQTVRNTLLLGLADGQMVGLMRDGHRLYSYNPGYPTSSDPVTQALAGPDGSIIVVAGNTVAAVTVTRHIIWKLHFKSYITAGRVSVVQDHVYLTTATGHLWEIDATSGRPLGQVKATRSLYFWPIVDEGRVVLAGGAGIQVFSANTLQPLYYILYSMKLPLFPTQEPIAYEGTILTVNIDAELCAYHASPST